MTTFKKGDLVIFAHETEHPVSLVTGVDEREESVNVLLFLRNDGAYAQCLLNALEEESIDVYDFLRDTRGLKNGMPTRLKRFLEEGYIIAFANNMRANAFVHLTPQHIDSFQQLRPYKDLLLHIMNKKPGRVIAPNIHL